MLYDHGELDTFEVRALTSLKLKFSYFTDDDNKRVTSTISEEQKLSLLTREFDKEHKEVFKIYRGLVKEISTRAVKYGMSKSEQEKCIIIKMDCSSEGESDIQYIKLYDIVEVNDIDHIYKELEATPISIEKHGEEWISDSLSKESEVDISGKVEVKK